MVASEYAPHVIEAIVAESPLATWARAVPTAPAVFGPHEAHGMRLNHTSRCSHRRVPGVPQGDDRLTVVNATPVVGQLDPVARWAPYAMRAAVTGILPYLSPTAIVMSFAKGIEKDSRQTMAEMVPTILPPGTPFVVVGGPMLAGEITGGMAAIGVFASKDVVALQAAKALFASESFNVETVADPESVARGIGPICAGKWGW